MDSAGNLFGTTYYGGNSCGGIETCGTVFKLTPDGIYSVLHSFSGSDDGAFPESGLFSDGTGNLYGVTTRGGGLGSSTCGDLGCGVIYKLAPNGTETVLFRFSGADGNYPFGNLTFDTKGNLYGITWLGGVSSQSCPNGTNGCGVVFKLSKHRKQTVLHSFCSEQNCADGYDLYSGVTVDSAGNIYGTTFGGGMSPYCGDCGVIFKISIDGVETIVRNFCSESKCRDGSHSQTSVVFDESGNLYGATDVPGNVFQLAPDGKYSVLGNFHCKRNSCGQFPFGNFVADDNFDTLYGVAQTGGLENSGVVFSVSTSHRK